MKARSTARKRNYTHRRYKICKDEKLSIKTKSDLNQNYNANPDLDVIRNHNFNII